MFDRQKYMREYKRKDYSELTHKQQVMRELNRKNYLKTEKYRLWYKKNKNRKRLLQLEMRHEKGISKKYKSEIKGLPKKYYRQRYKAMKKKGGILPIKRIQMVYEDNIKKYGTLTCYLCEKPVLFSKDNLEHKTPLSRGGTNKYSNLAIACQKCNNKKYNKTEKEYRRIKYQTR